MAEENKAIRNQNIREFFAVLNERSEEDLKQSIVCDKQQMITLQKEIETKERLLNLFEGKRKNEHKTQ